MRDDRQSFVDPCRRDRKWIGRRLVQKLMTNLMREDAPNFRFAILRDDRLNHSQVWVGRARNPFLAIGGQGPGEVLVALVHPDPDRLHP